MTKFCTIVDEKGCQRDRLEHDLAAALAKNERRRVALEAVEWVWIDPQGFEEDTTLWCPWCEHFKSEGHAPDCQREAALN